MGWLAIVVPRLDVSPQSALMRRRRHTAGVIRHLADGLSGTVTERHSYAVTCHTSKRARHARSKLP